MYVTYNINWKMKFKLSMNKIYLQATCMQVYIYFLKHDLWDHQELAS